MQVILAHKIFYVSQKLIFWVYMYSLFLLHFRICNHATETTIMYEEETGA